MLKSCFGICLVGMAFVLFLVGCGDTATAASSTATDSSCAGYSVSNAYFTDSMLIQFAHPDQYGEGYKDWVCIDDPNAPSTTTTHYQVCVLQSSWQCYIPAFRLQAIVIPGLPGTSFWLAVFRNGNWPATAEANQIQAQVQLKS